METYEFVWMFCIIYVLINVYPFVIKYYKYSVDKLATLADGMSLPRNHSIQIMKWQIMLSLVPTDCYYSTLTVSTTSLYTR